MAEEWQNLTPAARDFCVITELKQDQLRFSHYTHTAFCMIQTTWVTVSLNILTANKILPGINVLPFLVYSGSFLEYKHISMMNSTLWIRKQWPTGRNNCNWLSAYYFLNVTQQISMTSPVPNHLWSLQGTWSFCF